MSGGQALELGCGRGVGAELILDQFGAGTVDAFDLDPRMVKLAQARLARNGERVRVWVGDAETIAVPDASYDAVFDFGIIHHVTSWRKVLAEVNRVLKPGGVFYAEEALAGLVDNPLARLLFEHPKDDRFRQEDFTSAYRLSVCGSAHRSTPGTTLVGLWPRRITLYLAAKIKRTAPRRRS